MPVSKKCGNMKMWRCENGLMLDAEKIDERKINKIKII
jgi:hypothetical protein